MTDQFAEIPIEQPQEPAAGQPSRRIWIVLVLIALGLLAAAIVLVLISRNDETATDTGALRIGWAIPDGESLAGTLTLTVHPASKGKNELGITIEPASPNWLSDVNSVSVRLLPLRGSAETRILDLELPSGDQRASAQIDFTGSDQWEARVTTADTVLATFFIVLPDPNLHGEDGVELMPEDPQARALYERASADVAGWHRVHYEQQLSDGAGRAVVSFRDINDGSDGSLPGFRYFTPGGLEAYVLDTTAWSRYPGEPWEVRETNAMIPPSEWGGEYLGATGFQLGPISDSRQGPCRIVTFVVPTSERQAVAWYAWCIDEATGQVRRDSMISRVHYMITEFSDIDGAIVVRPPADAPPAVVASPIAVAG